MQAGQQDKPTFLGLTQLGFLGHARDIEGAYALGQQPATPPAGPRFETSTEGGTQLVDRAPTEELSPVTMEMRRIAAGRPFAERMAYVRGSQGTLPALQPVESAQEQTTARKGDLKQRLIAEARTTQSAINGTPASELQDQITSLGSASGARLTVIRIDGVVLADSEHDPATMDLRKARPEADEYRQREQMSF